MKIFNGSPCGLFLACFLCFSGGTPIKASSSTQDPLVIYIRESFYKTCAPLLKEISGEKIRFVSLSSSLLMGRLRREKSQSHADLVIGTDSCFLPELIDLDVAGDNDLSSEEFSVPVSWHTPKIVPFTYGYLGFLYKADRLKDLPKTLEDLLKLPLKIVMPHPRTSTVGLVFADWMKNASGPNFSKNWGAFQERLISLPKGLSQAFALFMSEEADLMVGYTTSTEYAAVLHQDRSVRFIPFKKLPFHGYTAFITQKGAEKPLANKLLRALLQKSFQKDIIKKDCLYPVKGSLQQEKLFQEKEPTPDTPVNMFGQKSRRKLLNYLEKLSSL